MRVEECCGALLRALLPAIDPDRAGACIEIGVGTSYPYFEIFSASGFKTYAVEPLPTPHVRDSCAHHTTTLIEACVSEMSGHRDLYIGEARGQEMLNYNSLQSDWWGVGGKSKSVPSLTVADLMERVSEQAITCMKIDIEGAEPLVIGQFGDIPATRLPSVVMFEYGGGGQRAGGAAGWQDKFFQGTLECVQTLSAVGFETLIVIDSEASAIEQVVEVSTLSSPESLFGPTAEYGNIIACRGLPLPPDAIHTFCAQFHGPE
jgi:FkbM family methyltransferase